MAALLLSVPLTLRRTLLGTKVAGQLLEGRVVKLEPVNIGHVEPLHRALGARFADLSDKFARS